MTTCRESGFAIRGFVMPAAMFLLVILAALGAYLVSFSNTQQITSAQDVQGVRAYWAARAAAENGLAQVLQPESETGAASFPACATPSVTLSGDLAAFSAQVVSCTRTPLSTAVPNYQTDPLTGYRYVTYNLLARASQGTQGSVGYYEREVSVTAVKCKDPNAKLADNLTPDPRNRCSGE